MDILLTLLSPRLIVYLRWLLQVEACLQSLRAAVADGSIPWGAVNASGFAHSAISWEGEDRHANPFTEGSKDYVVLVLPGDQYITFLLSGGNQC